MPCGFTTAGLPIGLQILAAPFEEEKLLRVARMYEQATDWHTRRPETAGDRTMSAVLTPPAPTSPWPAPAAPSPVAPGVRSSTYLVKVADLPFFPRTLAFGDVRYELDDGVPIIRSLPGSRHGTVQLNVGTELKIQGDRAGHGKAMAEVAVILRRNPDRVVGPDVAFIANRSLPIRLSKEGYLETLPDIIVEVRSKNDTGPEVFANVKEYLDAGVAVVWVADPDAVTIAEHRLGQPVKTSGPARR